MYTVRRLREGCRASLEDGDDRVDATDHRDAAARSLLAEPGARLVVNDAHTTIRYHIDAIGRIVEQSRYSA
jgi:hypothetical protein